MIAAAVAFLVAINCWIVGFLQLGWILNSVSLPVLTGFVSAAALVIISREVPPIFGLPTSSGEANLIHDFFVSLPKTHWHTFAVGIFGIVFIVSLQQIGKFWGKKNRVIWIVSILRYAIVLVLFTAISYFVNKDLQTPLVSVTGKVNAGLIPVKLPNMTLVAKLAIRSAPVFVAASVSCLPLE